MLQSVIFVGHMSFFIFPRSIAPPLDQTKYLSKEEKKALAKAKRDAKKKKKVGDDGINDGGEGGVKSDAADEIKKIFSSDKNESSSSSAAERLIEAGTICTYSASRKIDPRSRDINVQNLTLQHRGNVMLDDTQITLNHGNRYGLLGRVCFRLFHSRSRVRKIEK